MPVRVRIPTPLRPLTGGRGEVEAAGGSVGEVLDNLESTHRGFVANVLQDGQIRRFVNLYLNDEDVRYMSGLQTPVSDGDTLSIIPAIAGGLAVDAGPHAAYL